MHYNLLCLTYTIYIIITLQSNICLAEGIQLDSLKHYEPLKLTELHHHVKRRSIKPLEDIDDYDSTTHVTFKSHERIFNLNLVPDDELFTSNFKVVALSNTEKDRIVPYQKDHVLKGYIEGESSSYVEGHFDDGMLTASIYTKDDTFYVEPSWRHLKEKHDFEMIVYRLSDVIQNVTFSNSSASHCANIGVDNSSTEDNLKEPTDSDKSRQRRQIGGLDTCRVVLVADYKFFLHMGQQQLSQTVNYMTSVFQRANKIFRETVWPSQLTNIGFEVDEVKVHTTPGTPLYNEQRLTSWDAETLLSAFSRSNWSAVCLAHLFTYHDFSKGVIGLAYVATAPLDAPGGICSKVYPEKNGGQLRYLNSGLSTSLNWGRRLLTAEADIVTAHELGHNFGAQHDPETSQCAPSDANGGKYIMYTTSVSGANRNNKIFSSCSARSIDAVLASKRILCFKAKTGKFCGNFNVEQGEDCDPGLDAVRANSDPCCDRNCKFRIGVKCSDSNALCCTNCKFSPKSKVCREEFTQACQGKTICTGSTASCPSSPLLDGPDCYGGGRCRKGKCLGVCEVHNKIGCTCDTDDNRCKICCKEIGNGTNTCNILVSNGTEMNHIDGQPCNAGSKPGFCLNGKCQKSQSNVLDQFLSLVSDFTISKFAVFMKENLVGFILIFSLIFWIPAGCIINRIDKRHDKEERDRQWWYDPKNTELMRKARDRNKQNRIFRNTGGKRMPRDIGTGMYGQPAPLPSQGRLEVTDNYIVAV